MFFEYYNIMKARCYEEVKELPAALREAQIFRKTMEEIPIAIKSEDRIAGWYGSEEKPSEAEEKILPETDPYTENVYSEEDKKILDAMDADFAMRLGFGPGHTCIDYGRIVDEGLISYEEKIWSELQNEDIGEEKRIYLEAMRFSLDAVKIYAGRFARLAEELAAKACGEGKERLEKIQKTMNRVPWLPARDFHEALSAVWIMHTVIPVSDNSWASISLGRVDQYLYPIYCKSLEAGESREEMKEYLLNLFRLLNAYGDGACALNIGGMDGEGRDQNNELSLLLLEVEKEMCQPSPILAVRVHPEMPEEILDAVIDKKLFSVGQPTFYGELPCRKAMIERGITEADAVRFSVNSCMGLFLSGEEVASMWGCLMSMHLPLEMAVNAGVPLYAPLPFALQAEVPAEIDSLETLWNAYEVYLRGILGKLLELNRKSEISFAKNRPNPLLSAITASCVESGLDRAVGAKYITETVETMGFANTANAIAAIDTLVFREKKYTLAQWVEATRQDFAGCENLLYDIKNCDKYGTNSAHADGICRRLCEIMSKVCKELSFDNVYYIPSMHTLDSNVSFGNDLYTTMDGRKKGEPVNKNAGPTNDVRSADPTSLILSAASLRQELYSGGQPIDLYFDPVMLEDKAKRDKIKSLIKTYFQLGGLQIQVNSIDVELLEKAYERPQDYPNVVVRIGGYSRSFHDLSKDVQREFIERFRKER